MDYGNLQQWVDQGFDMPEDWIAVIAHALLSAIDHLSGHKHIHRDVKPSNILISRTGEVRRARLVKMKQVVFYCV